MPLRLSMDLNATVCSRLRVKWENFQTRIRSKGAFGWLPSSIISLNWGLSATRPLSASSTYSRATEVAVGPGVVFERPQLGGHGQVHVLPVAGHPGV